jgi:16S rRNA (cytosine1402-N4)-methyltransferase
MAKFHEPVLVKEAINFLKVEKGKKYIDATLGGGGHSQEILKLGGKLLGIDCDPKALEFSRKRLASACPPGASCWKLIRDNFAHLKKIASSAGFKKSAGILFDLGASLFQLQAERKGFSFKENSRLDMRMDPDLKITAYDLVNGLSKNELERIFKTYGEERWSRRIAKAIVAQRKRQPIETSYQLAELILRTVGRSFKRTGFHPATRCFQALRIIVNNELENLKVALPQAVKLLEKNGRLVIISFHSLEDRIVKNFFRQEKDEQNLAVLTKKPIRPSQDEVRQNPSSRSAKLRAAERI